MRLSHALLAALLLLAPNLARAEAPPVDAATAIFPPVRERTIETFDLKSKAGLDYRISISLPSGPTPATGFPVAYVVDGNAWFGVAAEVARLTEGGGAPMVVVGIGYPTQALFDMRRRVRDMTPPAPDSASDARLGKLEYGGVSDFMAFIRDTLRPEIGRRLTLDPNHQTLIGHSLGGLFALEQLFADPGAFQTYVAASPAIHFNNAAILEQAKAFVARKDLPPSRRILLTVGSFEQGTRPEEEALMRVLVAGHPELFPGEKLDDVIAEWKGTRERERMVDNASDMAASLKAAGLDARFAVFEGEDHLSAAVVGINRALPFIQEGAR
jgi:predicted alpha/beta superfamily hydrolase